MRNDEFNVEIVRNEGPMSIAEISAAQDTEFTSFNTETVSHGDELNDPKPTNDSPRQEPERKRTSSSSSSDTVQRAQSATSTASTASTAAASTAGAASVASSAVVGATMVGVALAGAGIGINLSAEEPTPEPEPAYSEVHTQIEGDWVYAYLELPLAHFEEIGQINPDDRSPVVNEGQFYAVLTSGDWSRQCECDYFFYAETNTVAIMAEWYELTLGLDYTLRFYEWSEEDYHYCSEEYSFHLDEPADIPSMMVASVTPGFTDAEITAYVPYSYFDEFGTDGVHPVMEDNRFVIKICPAESTYQWEQVVATNCEYDDENNAIVLYATATDLNAGTDYAAVVYDTATSHLSEFYFFATQNGDPSPMTYYEIIFGEASTDSAYATVYVPYGHYKEFDPDTGRPILDYSNHFTAILDRVDGSAATRRFSCDYEFDDEKQAIVVTLRYTNLTANTEYYANLEEVQDHQYVVITNACRFTTEPEAGPDPTTYYDVNFRESSTSAAYCVVNIPYDHYKLFDSDMGHPVFESTDPFIAVLDRADGADYARRFNADYEFDDEQRLVVVTLFYTDLDAGTEYYASLEEVQNGLYVAITEPYLFSTQSDAGHESEPPEVNLDNLTDSTAEFHVDIPYSYYAKFEEGTGHPIFEDEQPFYFLLALNGQIVAFDPANYAFNDATQTVVVDWSCYDLYPETTYLVALYQVVDGERQSLSPDFMFETLAS